MEVPVDIMACSFYSCSSSSPAYRQEQSPEGELESDDWVMLHDIETLPEALKCRRTHEQELPVTKSECRKQNPYSEHPNCQLCRRPHLARTSLEQTSCLLSGRHHCRRCTRVICDRLNCWCDEYKMCSTCCEVLAKEEADVKLLAQFAMEPTLGRSTAQASMTAINIAGNYGPAVVQLHLTALKFQHVQIADTSSSAIHA